MTSERKPSRIPKQRNIVLFFFPFTSDAPRFIQYSEIQERKVHLNIKFGFERIERA